MARPRPTLDPRPAALCAAAERALAAGRLDEARRLARQALDADRDAAPAAFVLGLVALQSRRAAEALECLDRAVAAAPGCAAYQAQRARCLSLLRRDAEALATAEAALAAGPADAFSFDTLGVVLSRAGRHAHAVEAYREAARRAPANPGYAFNLGSALKFVGDFEGAEAAYEAAVAAAPRLYKAHCALAQLRRQTPARNHVARLEALLAEIGDDVNGELQLRHALAKELEDLGQHDRAFAELAAGKRRKRATLAYDPADDAALVDAVMAAFQATVPAPAAAPGGPIFVVGLPRTGTTLVDRILASHPEGVSAGELQAFPLAFKHAAGTRTPRLLDAATLARVAGLDFDALGEDYRRRARAIVDGAGRFVDKMPLNFLYAGAIVRALPDAAIVCLRRHPLDTVLGNFRQLFALGFSYYDYAFDLEDTARYFVGFDRLLAHWRRVLPGRVLELGYEDLVADPPGQVRRLLDFCGLDFDPACLAFDRNAAPVATASAVQVRQPIHARGVGRWRRHAQVLEPARRIIEAAGIGCG